MYAQRSRPTGDGRNLFGHHTASLPLCRHGHFRAEGRKSGAQSTELAQWRAESLWDSGHGGPSSQQNCPVHTLDTFPSPTLPAMIVGAIPGILNET